MAITDWPEGERPREKLLMQGVESLSDAELIAIFLRVGVTGKSAVDLARDLLNKFGSLNGIFSANLAEICTVHGMGESKFCQLQAIFEMSRRALNEEMHHQAIFDSSRKVSDYLKLKIGRNQREVFTVLFLNAQHYMLADEIIFSGTLMQTSVHPREVVKRALHHNAAAVILAHNHPSGNFYPSESDKLLTKSLKDALGLVDVQVLDHIIVTEQQTFSFAENGLL
jgi:DNA repair protein RadC